MMNRCVRYIGIIVAAIFASLSGVAAQTATEALDKAAKAFEASGGMKVNFTMTFSENGKTAETQTGVIDLRGDKFVLRIPGMSIFYNGKDQWVYVENNEEVNLTTPTGDELLTTNPILLLRYYKKNFNAYMKNANVSIGGASVWNIELKPKSKGSIVSVSMLVNKKTYFPEQITVVPKSGQETKVRINKVVTGVNQSDGFFVFDAKKYPNAEVIDLR
jgi:outer membrane lipoprotein-sorting protein